MSCAAAFVGLSQVFCCMGRQSNTLDLDRARSAEDFHVPLLGLQKPRSNPLFYTRSRKEQTTRRKKGEKNRNIWGLLLSLTPLYHA